MEITSVCKCVSTFKDIHFSLIYQTSFKIFQEYVSLFLIPLIFFIGLTGSGSNQEKLQLVRGKPIPGSAGSFRLSLAGRYVYVHTDFGITLIWDQGTWFQVKLDPVYKGKVRPIPMHVHCP